MQARKPGRPKGSFKRSACAKLYSRYINNMRRNMLVKDLPFQIDKYNWQTDKFSLIKARRNKFEKPRKDEGSCVPGYYPQNEMENNNISFENNHTPSFNLQCLNLRSPITETQLHKHFPNMFKKRLKLRLERLLSSKTHNRYMPTISSSDNKNYEKQNDEKTEICSNMGELNIKLESNQILKTIDTSSILTSDQFDKLKSKLNAVLKRKKDEKSSNLTETAVTLCSRNDLNVSTEKVLQAHEYEHNDDFEREAPSLIEIDECNQCSISSNEIISNPPVLEMECPLSFVSFSSNKNDEQIYPDNQTYTDKSAPCIERYVYIPESTFIPPTKTSSEETFLAKKFEDCSSLKLLVYQNDVDNDQNESCDKFIELDTCERGRYSKEDNASVWSESVASADENEKCDKFIELDTCVSIRNSKEDNTATWSESVTTTEENNNCSKPLYQAEPLSSQYKLEFADSSPLNLPTKTQSHSLCLDQSLVPDKKDEIKHKSENKPNVVSVENNPVMPGANVTMNSQSKCYDSDATVIYSDDDDIHDSDMGSMTGTHCDPNRDNRNNSREKESVRTDEKKNMSLHSPDYVINDTALKIDEDVKPKIKEVHHHKKRGSMDVRKNKSKQKDQLKQEKSRKKNTNKKFKLPRPAFHGQNNQKDTDTSLTLTITREPIHDKKASSDVKLKTKKRQSKSSDSSRSHDSSETSNTHVHSKSEGQTPLHPPAKNRPDKRKSKKDRNFKKSNSLSRRRKREKDLLRSIDEVFPRMNEINSDEDDLPTILPPKRRRVLISKKVTDMKQNPDSGMERIIQEFPRHNWLENKYMKEQTKDPQVSNDSNFQNENRQITNSTQNTEMNTGSDTNEKTNMENVQDPKTTCTRESDSITIERETIHVDSENENQPYMDSDDRLVDTVTNEHSVIDTDETKSTDVSSAATTPLDLAAKPSDSAEEKTSLSKSQADDTGNSLVVDTRNVAFPEPQSSSGQQDDNNLTSVAQTNVKSDLVIPSTPEHMQIRSSVKETLPPVPQLIPALPSPATHILPRVTASSKIEYPIMSTSSEFNRNSNVCHRDSSNSNKRSAPSCTNSSWSAMKYSFPNGQSCPNVNRETFGGHNDPNSNIFPTTSTGFNRIEVLDQVPIDIIPKHTVVDCTRQTLQQKPVTGQTYGTVTRQSHVGLSSGLKLYRNDVSQIPSAASNSKLITLTEREHNNSSNDFNLTVCQANERNIDRNQGEHFQNLDISKIQGNRPIVDDLDVLRNNSGSQDYQNFERVLHEFQEIEKMAAIKAREREELLSLRERKINELNVMKRKVLTGNLHLGISENICHEHFNGGLQKAKERVLTEENRTPPPAHMKHREDIQDILSKIDKHPVVIPADIMSSCPFRSRKIPITLAPESRERSNKSQEPVKAHSQIAFQDNGAIFPLPSFMAKGIAFDKRRTNSTPATEITPRKTERASSAPSTCDQKNIISKPNQCFSDLKSDKDFVKSKQFNYSSNATLTPSRNEVRQSLKRTNSDTVIDLSGTDCDPTFSNIDKQRTEIEIQRELHAAVAVKRQKQEAVTKIDTSKVIDLNKNIRTSENVVHMSSGAHLMQRPHPPLVNLSHRPRIPFSHNGMTPTRSNIAMEHCAANANNTQLTRELLRNQPMMIRQRCQAPVVIDQNAQVNDRPRNLPYAQMSPQQLNHNTIRHPSVPLPVQTYQTNQLRPQTVRLLGAAVMSNEQQRPVHTRYQQPINMRNPLPIYAGTPDVGNSVVRFPVGSIQHGTPVRGPVVQKTDNPRMESSKTTATNSRNMALSVMQKNITSVSLQSSVIPQTLKVPTQQNQHPQHLHKLAQTQIKQDTMTLPVQSKVIRPTGGSNQLTHINGKCIMCTKFACYLCSNCQRFWYCSQQCQLKHWVTHQNECKTSSVTTQPSAPLAL